MEIESDHILIALLFLIIIGLYIIVCLLDIEKNTWLLNAYASEIYGLPRSKEE